MKLLYLGHFDDLRDLKEIKEKKRRGKVTDILILEIEIMFYRIAKLIK